MKFEILVGALYWRHIGFYASSFSALILLPVLACARYKVVCILCGWWTKFGASGVLFFRNRNESSYRLYIIHWICVKDIPYIAFWCSNHNLCGFLFRKQNYVFFVSVVCLTKFQFFCFCHSICKGCGEEDQCILQIIQLARSAVSIANQGVWLNSAWNIPKFNSSQCIKPQKSQRSICLDFVAPCSGCHCKCGLSKSESFSSWNPQRRAGIPSFQLIYFLLESITLMACEKQSFSSLPCALHAK